MKDWILRYQNLPPKFYKGLGKSLKDILEMSEWQSYIPIMSLFFHIHNTKNSHKCITFDNRYIIKELKEFIKQENSEEYKSTSNGIYKAVVWDSRNNKELNMEIFCKVCSLLDAVSYMQGNYCARLRRHHLLPSNYNHNTFTKINSFDNSAYIDAFFCYISSFLREKHKLPCFPLYYGSFNGIINEFFYDISEEYYSLKNEEWFEENLGHLFSLDVGVVKDSDEESDGEDEEEKPRIEELPSSDEEDEKKEEKEEKDNNDEDNKSESNSSNYSESNDYIAVFEDYPVQSIFMEKCDLTLGELLEQEYTDRQLKSILFQIIFGLTYLQKHFDFTHNDLHVNNIMLSKTDKKFLVYNADKTFFRVPTCGYIAKIIDYGRAIFTFRNRTYFNDVFSNYGEAEGQYSYPKPDIPFYKSPFIEKNEKGEPVKKETVLPNPNFDVTRLATTIMDDLVKAERRRIRTNEESSKVDNQENSDNDSDISDSEMEKYYPENSEIFEFLKKCVTDDEGINLHLEEESFDLYKRIAKHARNATPKNLLMNSLFSNYKTQRKMVKNARIYKI